MPELSEPNFSEAFKHFMGSHIVQLQLPTLRQILARFDTSTVARRAGALAWFLAHIPPTSWKEAHRMALEVWDDLLSLEGDDLLPLEEADRSYLLGIDLGPTTRELHAAIGLLEQAGWSQDQIGTRLPLMVRTLLDPCFALALHLEFMESNGVLLNTFCDSRVRKPDDENCPICFKKSPDTVKLRECKHIFCRECISVWVNGSSQGGTKTCPTCRSGLTN